MHFSSAKHPQVAVGSCYQMVLLQFFADWASNWKFKPRGWLTMVCVQLRTSCRVPVFEWLLLAVIEFLYFALVV